MRGTWDDVLPRRDPRWSEAVLWWHDELSGADRHWLANLPRSHDLVVGGRRVRMFRASATSVRTRVRFHHTPEEFDGMFAATELTGSGPAPDVVLYGDIHDAYVEARSRRTLANDGSVGNALDEPTAACLVLEGDLGGPVQEAPWSPFGLQIVRVPYDVEACAVELRTGIHRGLHAEPGLRRPPVLADRRSRSPESIPRPIRRADRLRYGRSAARIGSNFASDSASSASGSEAATTPHPAKSRSVRASVISPERRAMPHSPSPSAPIHPTGPA